MHAYVTLSGSHWISHLISGKIQSILTTTTLQPHYYAHRYYANRL